MKRRVEPDVASLLARVAQLAMSDQQIHERAGLPSGWLSQARAGRYGARARSCRRLEEWLGGLQAKNGEATPLAAGTVEGLRADVAGLRSVVEELRGVAKELRDSLAVVKFHQGTVGLCIDALLESLKEAKRIG